MNKTLSGAAVAGLLLLPALAWSRGGVEEVLTPAQYFDCQIAAQEAAIVGLQERVAQQGKPGISDAQRRATAELARERITLAIYNCGRQTAATLGAYAHRNAEELKTWLVAHPKMRERLDDQVRRRSALSARLSVNPSASR